MSPPTAGPPVAVRRRPSAWWFAVGGLLLLLAPALFVGGLLWTLRPLVHRDGTLPADGRAHRLVVPAHTQRALFRPAAAPSPSCHLTDADGQRVLPRPVSGSYRTTVGGTSYLAWGQFDTRSGVLRVACVPPPGPPMTIVVAAVPSTHQLVGGVLVSVLGPIVLGLGGVAVIVVVAVLRSRRPNPGPSAGVYPR